MCKRDGKTVCGIETEREMRVSIRERDKQSERESKCVRKSVNMTEREREEKCVSG